MRAVTFNDKDEPDELSDAAKEFLVFYGTAFARDRTETRFAGSFLF